MKIPFPAFCRWRTYKWASLWWEQNRLTAKGDDNAKLYLRTCEIRNLNWTSCHRILAKWSRFDDRRKLRRGTNPIHDPFGRVGDPARAKLASHKGAVHKDIVSVSDRHLHCYLFPPVPKREAWFGRQRPMGDHGHRLWWHTTRMASKCQQNLASLPRCLRRWWRWHRWRRITRNTLTVTRGPAFAGLLHVYFFIVNFF